MSSAKRKKTTRRKPTRKNTQQTNFLKGEIILLLVLALSIVLLISNFGLGGYFGKIVNQVFFGMFGFMAYVFPFALFLIAAFLVSNTKNGIAKIKAVAAGVLFICVCVFIELISARYDGGRKLMDYYEFSSEYKTGGGLVSGLLCKVFCPAFGVVGTYVLLGAFVLICVVLITEKSILSSIKNGSSKVARSAKEDMARRNTLRKEEAARRREEALEEEEEELEAMPRSRRKVKGVALNTEIPKEEMKTDEVREIAPKPKPFNFTIQRNEPEPEPEEDLDAYEPLVQDKPIVDVTAPEADVVAQAIELEVNTAAAEPDILPAINIETADDILFDEEEPAVSVQAEALAEEPDKADFESDIAAAVQAKPKPKPKPYKFPPRSFLKRGSGKKGGDSDAHLRETALKLQQTLHNFGVEVTITNISCGPTITRYELLPEMGVKVNKIVNLADDIKLNLAATDIRIEAPIPGKAAVGIEVPNEKNSTVMFRDLIDSDEYKNHPSNLAFAAGKDIGGQVLITDIAKMPHLLIAGATGSGKSVCINTLIMSILYKAKPEDVKLIMIDPKVVELSVYNGIPHLMIPVVTDPKKAAGALSWAVAEMNERYKKFADYNVRDLKGYNEKVEAIKDIEDENKPEKLPQIVIIVDELADLMMVSSKEVEDHICRLAQLARAAGLHLIIATQRPSVNVITGLIKANMPSKIAFSVTSGIDSRTIIGMNGAEKLLGKGDMLFYPQGYPKPARAQGAFISDDEVMKVVEFLAKQNVDAGYDAEIEEKISNAQASAPGNEPAAAPGDDRDAYFTEAGKFIIEKEKASIGMLQRMFKIGFNRAARIMDQLADAGVVGEEEGTKPRKVLMTMEEFEAYIDQYV